MKATGKMDISKEEWLADADRGAEWRLMAYRLYAELRCARAILRLNTNSARDIFICGVDTLIEDYKALEAKNG